MIRFMMVLYQISIIAIVVGIIFGPEYRKADAGLSNRQTTIDSTDLRNGLIVGAVLSVLTLPWPSWFVYCLKTKLVAEATLEQEKKSKHAKSSSSAAKFTDIQNRQQEHTSRSHEDDDETGKISSSQRANTVGEDASLKGKKRSSQQRPNCC